MYELTLSVKTKEQFHELWESSEEIWRKVEVTMRGNNEETKELIRDSTEKLSEKEVDELLAKPDEEDLTGHTKAELLNEGE